MFIEDMTRLFNRADPAMPEAQKVRHLMRGVKEQLFARLVRDPPRTVSSDFTKEAMGIERSLQERGAHYGRQATVAAASQSQYMPTSLPADELRELVRSLVREELAKLRFEAPQVSVAAVTDVVREKIRVVQPPPAPHPVPSVMMYIEALRSPGPAMRAFSPIAPVPYLQEPIATAPSVPQEFRPL
ncbi:hypothetical protein V5799_014620 [Amblyomma americanum]|uniref:Uncharacterized protein n=1 Tax=Amblyomma americanum TaxID=6943 RepID=A0AAQ4E2H1_AMBAM